MTESFIITLPITEAQADMAGIPASWLDRAVRAVGQPTEMIQPRFAYGFTRMEHCECEVPMIRCDDMGCHCTRCGKPEKLTLMNTDA